MTTVLAIQRVFYAFHEASAAFAGRRRQQWYNPATELPPIAPC